VAGSTHAGEESTLLEAHRRLLQALPSALLILAPRHPQRFDSVAAAVAAFGFSFARRSQATPDTLPPDTLPHVSVLLLDTLGELMSFYAAADLAFVGGSLVPIGGHNLLEPASLGLAVLTGPYQFNSPQVVRALSDLGALTVVHDAVELSNALQQLLNDPLARASQGAAARAAIEANRGALARVLELIDTVETQAR
jgi:3-deoxy-D-manno-octulosonic-acid transferase